ncbi:uncharacterized protein RCO7_10200 [Rhynchosporium graminicola]|uniref:Uncharacterized protein n=1 Tax=Rhynchosporium graminicola TaxID=2792576 RepID=A0A1E1K3T7_9HELO|nr:uncharacterized protein RCO7_10200 [Rhynchosporium commune]
MAPHPIHPTVPAPPAPPALPLTAWARKYGKFSVNDRKSGLTPTGYTFPRLGNQLNSESIYEAHQTRKLLGFTSRELGQLDCLPTRELVPSTLPTYILPMLRIENWEIEPAQPDFGRDALYPMANGQGMWVASNPVVWSLLKPILSLATTMLMSIHILPWFDALINAPRVPIPATRLSPEDQGRNDLYSFQARPAIQFGQPTASPIDRDKAFSILQHQFKYTFGFMKFGEDPQGSEHDPEASAMTSTNYDYMRYDPTPNKIPRVFTWLDYAGFEHLLRDDLNSAERMCIEWSVANTIAHEVMHAIMYLRTALKGDFHGIENYFELEALAEVGNSFEKAINLGSTRPFLTADRLQSPPVAIPPLGYFFHRLYPTAYNIEDMDPDGAVLINPSISMVDEAFPIPITFYEDMQQEPFWSVAVRNFGHGLLHYRSRKEGSRTTLSITSNTREITYSKRKRFSALGHAYPALNNRFIAGVETLRLALLLTPEERRAMEFGRSLLISSKGEQAFWDSSALQKTRVDAAMTIMGSVNNVQLTQETQRTVLLGLIQCMVEAISNHQVQIAAIHGLEAVNRVTYPDRRAALMEWNRGTRVFLNALQTAKKGNHIEITPMLLDLEVARMVLVDPNKLTQLTTEELNEFQSIKIARAEYIQGNFTSCRNICAGILGTNWCSILARCSASAILFALDKDLYGGWDERKGDLVIANDMMDYCFAAAPAAWKALWDSLKIDLMDAVNALQRPSSPNQQLPETE